METVKMRLCGNLFFQIPSYLLMLSMLMIVSEGVRACLWGSVVGDRLWAGCLPYGRPAAMVRSCRGLMAGVGQVHLVTLDHGPYGAPSFTHPHLAAHSPARASPEHGTAYQRLRDRAVLVPASNQQKWGLCFSSLGPQRMLAACGGASSAHEDVHLGSLPIGCGSQCREALWVPVNMQTPEPLPHFLGQNLWEIPPKRGHFAHMSQVSRLEENILWSSVKT